MREPRKRIRKAAKIVVGQLVASTNKAHRVLLGKKCEISVEYDRLTYQIQKINT